MCSDTEKAGSLLLAAEDREKVLQADGKGKYTYPGEARKRLQGGGSHSQEPWKVGVGACHLL